MNNAITIFFFKHTNDCWTLTAPKYVKGYTYYIENFAFIKAMLNDKQLKNIKNVNQRRVSQDAFYNSIIRNWNEYIRLHRVVNPDKFYIYSNIMDGSKLNLDYPSFDKKEEALVWLETNKHSQWVKGVVKGKEVLEHMYCNCYVESYYTKEYSEKRQKEIIEVELPKIDKKIYKDYLQTNIKD